MSQKTILNIDDSATIRRLVDSTLSREGYRVVVAENAELGLQLAEELRPDLILLDHQLPGTTGADVCRQLIESPELRRIPVVISSTLRKKAYVEYTELSNVVDMLPKPYTEDLLVNTVINALDTGSLVVESQTQGTAVPEVINQQDDADLTGTFQSFGLREVLDFLNNGTQKGTLEVNAGNDRVWFTLENGRIQGVVATGVDPKQIAKALPDTLRELAPVLNLTVGGRMSAEADGIVELLNNKVLDPRLLRTLLRFQAALLVQRCFTGTLKGFRFEAGRAAPPLFRKLPLDISLMALLVEGAFHCPQEDLPEETPETAYVRKGIRGQNLDRAGLAARHMKIVGLLGEPIAAPELASRLDWDLDEVRRVLHGLVMAELVDRQTQSRAKRIAIWENEIVPAGPFRELFQVDSERFAGKIVRDRLGIQLLMKRSRPDVVVVPWNTDENRRFAQELAQSVDGPDSAVKWIGVLPANDDQGDEFNGFSVDGLLRSPYQRDDLISELNRVLAESHVTDAQPASTSPELLAAAHSE